jgi:hypothetical protein
MEKRVHVGGDKGCACEYEPETGPGGLVGKIVSCCRNSETAGALHLWCFFVADRQALESTIDIYKSSQGLTSILEQRKAAKYGMHFALLYRDGAQCLPCWQAAFSLMM